MTGEEPTLSADRLNQGREHLMREITLTRQPNLTSTAESPAPLRQRATWKKRRVMGGFASLATIAAITMVAIESGPSAAAAFSFQAISSDTVAVHIVNTAVGADEMTDQLQHQGLNVTIDAVPTSPQLVGTWLTVSFTDDVPTTVQDAVLAQVPNGYTATVDLPTSFPGDITFSIGRATRTGESARVVGQRNALAAGARLGCLHATGANPEDVQKAVQALGYSSSWADGDQVDLRPIAVPEPGQRIVQAFIDDTSPTQVQLVTATPGSTRYDARSRQGYAPTQWDTRNSNSGSCTPA